jgi:hypothetical protein
MTSTAEKTQRAHEKLIALEGLTKQIDALIEKRMKWEQGTYAASNAELYSVLGDCLDLFVTIKGNYSLPKGVNALLDTYGIKYTNATSLELKLVRLVFANSANSEQINNRLFAYARVIRVAADAKQTSATLAKFIAANHGIEEIRRASKDGVSATNKQEAQIEQARMHFYSPSDTELFSDFDLPDPLQPVDGEYFSLALVRKNADGTGSIVFGTNNTSAVATVLAIAGKALRKEVVKTAEEDAIERAEANKKKNMEMLSQSLVATLNTGHTEKTPTFNVSSTNAVLA